VKGPLAHVRTGIIEEIADEIAHGVQTRP
jgi:hypothetical protein